VHAPDPRDGVRERWETAYQSQSRDDLESRIRLDVRPASVVFERRPGRDEYDYELTVVLDYEAADVAEVERLAPPTGGPAATGLTPTCARAPPASSCGWAAPAGSC
jgi:hypothetical protein